MRRPDQPRPDDGRTLVRRPRGGWPAARPTRRLARRAAAAFALAGVAVGASACTASPPAATVGGVAISRSTLDDQLSVLASDAAAACVFTAEFAPGVASVAGAGQSTVTASVASAELDNLVVERLLQQDLRRHGVTVTAADIAAARQDLSVDVDRALVNDSQSGAVPPACASLTTNPVAALPDPFGGDVTRFLAVQEQFRALVGHVDISPPAVHAYYAAHPSEFEQACLNLVVADTQAAAQAIQAAVAGGQSIAVAASGPGANTQITPPGGQLTCQLPSVISGTFGSGDAALIYAATTGQVLGPMAWTDPATGVGHWLVVQVRQLSPAPESAVASQIRQQLLATTSAAAQSALQSVVRAADVQVDPRYGSWRPASGLVPPSTPPPADVLDPAANQATGGTGG